MGNNPKAPAQKPIDMNEALMNMKMKSKQFDRESSKSLKESEKNILKAKEHLKKGNEEGAKLFLELAAQKKNESLQYMRMSARLDHLAASIKSKTNSVQMVQELDRFTPLLQMQAENMPIEQMYKNLNQFSQAYDNLTVKGQILDNTMENTLAEKGSTASVDQMMKELQCEIQMEMGMAAPNQPVKEVNVQPQQTDKNADFFNSLKNL